MLVSQPTTDYFKFCPGEEHVKISNAICRGRRRTHFPKCPGCQFNDDEKHADTVISEAGRSREIAAIESLFRPHDVLGQAPYPLSIDVAWRVGHAAGQYLHGRLRGLERADPSVRSMVVGRDLRPISRQLQIALIDGIRSTGIDVIDIGAIDTPQIYFAVSHFRACGGIQTTGGRHPPGFSGFRICASKGFPIGAETGLTSIRDIALRVPRHDSGSSAGCREADLAQPYREFIRGALMGRGEFGRPLKMVVDVARGVTGKWMPIIFGNVRGLKINSLHADPQGRLERTPDPLDPKNTAELSKAVKTAGANLGVAFDGDASRCVFIDEKGASIAPDIIAALLARRFIERQRGASIVLDLRCTQAAVEEIDEAGGVCIPSRVGSQFIKKIMLERQAIFGADLGARYYFRDNSFCESAFLALAHVLNLMVETGRTLSNLVKPLARFRSSGPIDFECPDVDRVFRELADAHRDAQTSELDGLTIRYPEWSFTLRPASQPGSLSLTLEARTKKLVEERVHHLESIIGSRLRQ
jgi:phosphomannomutase